MMDFTHGVSLEETPRGDPKRRTVRDDIDEAAMERVYHQIARVHLHHFRHLNITAILFLILDTLETDMSSGLLIHLT